MVAARVVKVGRVVAVCTHEAHTAVRFKRVAAKDGKTDDASAALGNAEPMVTVQHFERHLAAPGAATRGSTYDWQGGIATVYLVLP